MLTNSIRSRIVGLVVITLVPCTLLIGAVIWKNYNDDRAEAAEQMLSHARLLAARLDNHFTALEALLAGIAKAVSPDPADADYNERLLRQLKGELLPYISSVQAFALDGSNIGSSSTTDRRLLYAGDRAYFQRIMAGDKFALGEPVLARTNGRWVVSVAHPVTDARGRILAVVTIGTLLENLKDALGLDDLPRSSAVQVVNENGILVGGKADASLRIGVDLSKTPFFADRLDGWSVDGARTIVWRDSIERITASAVADKSRWVVSVGVPREAAFSATNANLWSGISVGGLTLLVAVGLALVVTRHVIRPLKQLGQDAAILAFGNLGHRSPVCTQDEIGALATTLNQMAESLERRQKETDLARNRAEAEAIERRRVEETERQAKETLAAVIDASPVAIVCSNPQREIIIWSRSAERVFGHTSAEAIGLPTKLVPPGGQDQSQHLFAQAFAGVQIRGVEAKRLHKNGHLVDVRIAAAPIYDGAGRVSAVAWAYEDITEEKRAKAQLNRLAHYDQLTDLPNRVSLRSRLGELLGDGTPVAIALIDLDGFKHVNDTLGHFTGDRLLVEVGLRLKSVWEEGCEVFRLGGDEFVIVVPGCRDIRVAGDIGNSALERLSTPFEIDGHVIHVGGSIGMAIGPDDGLVMEDLLANADLALYESKASGGHTQSFFFPVLRARAQARRDLDLQLRRAFEENEFEIYFQPQVRLSDNAVVGAETLLRWNHPAHGLISPGAFIEALGESAIAPALGKWILRSACATLSEWRERGLALGRVAVNLFPVQVNCGTLSADIEEVLRETGLSPGALDLEITERAALDNNNAITSLERVFREGVQISFDDFGTGYASLSSLTQFPLTRLKIDRSFVKNAPSHAQDAAIVRSLIVMGHNLGLSVLAEGVESELHTAFLREAGCDEAQGFIYAEPLPVGRFEDYLAGASLGQADTPLPVGERRQRREQLRGRRSSPKQYGTS